MKLKILYESTYTIAAVMDGDECDAEEFLQNQESQHQASAVGLINLIEHISKYGLENLSDKQSHYIDKEEKIYELIKGRLRLVYFKGHGDLLVIATHGFLKKSNETPKSEKNKAINHKREYTLAHDKNILTFVRAEEDDEHDN